MTLLHDAPLDRRQFIRLVLGSAGSVLAIQLIPARAATPATHARWALLSDIHIKTEDDHAQQVKGCYYYNPHAHARRAVREILAARPEGLIVTGDVARLTGQLDDYKKAKEFLAPLKGRVPTFLAMGNHDDRDRFAEVIARRQSGQQSVPRKIVVVIEQGPVRFILLDSSIDIKEVEGRLGEDQLNWLRGYLAHCDNRPTVLCFHHVPDEEGKSLQDSPQLFDIIRPCAKVKAIVYGHSHVYRFDERDGIHLINLPASGYSFAATEAVGWIEGRFSAKGAAFAFHRMDGPENEKQKVHELAWRAAAAKPVSVL